MPTSKIRDLYFNDKQRKQSWFFRVSNLQSTLKSQLLFALASNSISQSDCEMTAKNCRHVSQALRLPEFRRALKAHESLACQLCAAPTAKQNSRARTGSASKKSGSLVSSPAPLQSSASSASLSSEDALQSWARSAAWEDLCICITCGFIGCLSGNHFSQHFQANPKHFVGFHAGAKTFWCCPCKHEIVDGKAKVEDARRECQESFDEIAAKQQRKIKNRVVVALPTAPADQMEPELGAEDAENEVDSEPLRATVADLTALKKKSSRVGNGKDTAESVAAADAEIGGDLQQATRKEKRGKEKKESRRSKALEKKSSSSNASEGADASAALMVPSVLGFTNLGNTCYFNAATQALLTVAHYFPEHVHLDEALEKPNSPILMTFSMLHETIKKKARRRSASSAERDAGDSNQKSKKRDGAGAKSDGVLTVAPLLKELRKKFAQFRGSYQQDAHELFMSFLWAIDEEADPPAVSATTSTESSGSEEKNDSKADQENDVEGIDSDDEDEDNDEQKQIFVKTETGETISMQVPKHATVQEVQHLLAKRLNLNEDDMVLDHGARPSSRQSAALRTQKSFSKLNFARNLFGGELTTVITCQACGNQSQTLEDAFQLSVPVPSSTTPLSLSTIDCLKNFMSETQLLVSAKNGYDCEECSRSKKSLDAPSSAVSTASTVSSASSVSSVNDHVLLRDATMHLVVSQLPRVLVIHIKRLGRLKKITQRIQFDSFMDMAPYIDSSSSSKKTKQSTFYELVAVVVHMGNKRSGHYVVYVSRSRKRDSQSFSVSGGNSNVEASLHGQQQMEQDSDDDFDPRAEIHTSENPSRSWYYISDTVVKRVAFEQVLQCEAYMLFYRQLPPEQQAN